MSTINPLTSSRDGLGQLSVLGKPIDTLQRLALVKSLRIADLDLVPEGDEFYYPLSLEEADDTGAGGLEQELRLAF